MQKFIPILFSTAMVQAILEGRKTMTRRIVNPQPDNGTILEIGEFHSIVIDKNGDEQPGELTFGAISTDCEHCIKCKYGQPGDILTVRELHYRFGIWIEDEGEFTKAGKQKWKFVATTDEVKYFDNPPESFGISKPKKNFEAKWYKRNSLFMPKAACRLFLKVKSVKVERLQDISEEDAKAEGLKLHESGKHWLNYEDEHWNLTQFIYNCDTAKRSFQSLWCLINGRNSWFANPWVWCISFERIEKPENFI